MIYTPIVFNRIEAVQWRNYYKCGTGLRTTNGMVKHPRVKSSMSCQHPKTGRNSSQDLEWQLRKRAVRLQLQWLEEEHSHQQTLQAREHGARRWRSCPHSPCAFRSAATVSQIQIYARRQFLMHCVWVSLQAQNSGKTSEEGVQKGKWKIASI